MLMNLDSVRLGCRCAVAAVDTDEGLKRRLEDFGLVPGTVLCPEYRSPGGHGTVLGFRGTLLALRTRDLKRIRVRV
ncbi:MAG: ferrous iron transport protein A [Oscillospiraceae bacterium]|nr:ferrous iron transport protein A [Oscillospiraceae bacterium]